MITEEQTNQTATSSLAALSDAGTEYAFFDMLPPDIQVILRNGVVQPMMSQCVDMYEALVRDGLPREEIRRRFIDSMLATEENERRAFMADELAAGHEAPGGVVAGVSPQREIGRRPGRKIKAPPPMRPMKEVQAGPPDMDAIPDPDALVITVRHKDADHLASALSQYCVDLEMSANPNSAKGRHAIATIVRLRDLLRGLHAVAREGEHKTAPFVGLRAIRRAQHVATAQWLYRRIMGALTQYGLQSAVATDVIQAAAMEALKETSVEADE